MPVEYQGRVHHRDLGLDQFAHNGGQQTRRQQDDTDSQEDNHRISYSAIVNKSIMNKLAWAKSGSSLLTSAGKTQHNNNQQQQQQQQNFNSNFNNSNINSSGGHEDHGAKFAQTMYRMSSMQLNSNRRYNQNQNFARQHSRSSSIGVGGLKSALVRQQQPPQQSAGISISSISSRSNSNTERTKPASYKTIMSPALIALIFALCLGATLTGHPVLASPEEPPAVGGQTTSNNQNQNQNGNSDRQQVTGGAEPSRRSEPSSLADSAATNEKSSIVASLSSAVASAAAAAAVAAAKSSLSAGDARSLLSAAAGSSAPGKLQHHANHLQRSPGLTFALKLADAIPEVPYSILHNMKKLDHAAPFYNVPGQKVALKAAGSGKESMAHGLLLSALLNNNGGAAEQLQSLFRSPLWKRLADGYDGFTSEFRSLFRSRPHTMKGPGAGHLSGKGLLRDLSVPAALMLLASAASLPSSGADWRPNMMSGLVKNRRKSQLALVDSSLPDLSAKLAASSSTLGQATTGSLEHHQLMLDSAASEPLRSYSPMPQQQQQQQHQQQQQFFGGQQPSYYYQRPSSFVAGDISAPQPAPQQALASEGSWLSSSSPPATAIDAIQQQQQQQRPAEQLAMKRVGDSVLYSAPNSPGAKYQQQQAEARDSAPLASGLMEVGLFSSLTSNLAKIAQPAKLLANRMMNANGLIIENHHQQQLIPAAASIAPLNGGGLSSLISPTAAAASPLARTELLGDKHRYSLAIADDEPKSSFLSSALGRAAARMLAVGSGSSSSPLSGDRTATIISSAPAMVRRDSNGGGRDQQQQQQQEPRDLSQLLPQSWREVVKRTVSSVKQEASTQWRSIEGQLSNWVQDKLKTLPMTPSQPAASSPVVSSTAAAAASGSAPALVSNLIGSVSSTALNMLGLGGRSGQPAAKGPNNSSSSSNNNNNPQEPTAAGSTVGPPTTNDSTSKASGSLKAGALAGVANMIVNTLTSRQQQQQAASQKPANAVDSSTDQAAAVIGQYPTLTGPQQAAAAASSSGAPAR